MGIRAKKCKNCFSNVGRQSGKCPVCGYAKGGRNEPSALAHGTKLAKRYVIGGMIGRGGKAVPLRRRTWLYGYHENRLFSDRTVFHGLLPRYQSRYLFSRNTYLLRIDREDSKKSIPALGG